MAWKPKGLKAQKSKGPIAWKPKGLKALEAKGLKGQKLASQKA